MNNAHLIESSVASLLRGMARSDFSRMAQNVIDDLEFHGVLSARGAKDVREYIPLATERFCLVPNVDASEHLVDLLNIALRVRVELKAKDAMKSARLVKGLADFDFAVGRYVSLSDAERAP